MANGHGGARTGAGRKPGAVSKAKRELMEMAKDHAGDALKTLCTIMKDKEAPHAARVTAANSILDRGYGRPVQRSELSGPDGKPIETRNALDMTDEELAAIAASGSD